MRRFFCSVIFLLPLGSLMAADAKGFFYLGAKDLPVEETASIRPATKGELKNSTRSAWLRGFTGEPSHDQIPTLLDIAPADKEHDKTSLDGYQSAVVPAGTYKLFARCKGRGAVLTFDGVIVVEKSKKYVVSCTGTTAASTHLVAAEEN